MGRHWGLSLTSSLFPVTRARRKGDSITCESPDRMPISLDTTADIDMCLFCSEQLAT